MRKTILMLCGLFLIIFKSTISYAAFQRNDIANTPLLKSPWDQDFAKNIREGMQLRQYYQRLQDEHQQRELMSQQLIQQKNVDYEAEKRKQIMIFKWCNLAAKQGDIDAQFTLGNMYRHGEGVPQNDAEAFRWLKSAAERGHPSAQNNLGLMYYYGYGIATNYVEAHKWVNIAAATAKTFNSMKISNSVKEMLESQMTRKQIATAQDLAQKWMKKNN